MRHSCKMTLSPVSALLLCLLVVNCSDSSNSVGTTPPTPMPGASEFLLVPDNPKVQQIVRAAQIDSIRSTVETLVAFQTRHTNSDTTSATIGIGAARRWVFNKFRSFSQRSGGRLQVRYHDFDATIVGVSGHHRNVVAELPGTVTPERKFLVSGHLDSRNADNRDAINFAGGANDDGSGVANALELARIMSPFEFESTLIFVAFTGEEQGLFGSRALARDLRQNNENIVGMVTNDIVGNIVGGSGTVDSLTVRCFSDGPPESPHRELARYVKLQGDVYVSNLTVNLIPSRDRPGRGGDHFSFNEQQYTAARLTEPEDNLQHQHNMADLVEFMSFPYLTKVVKLNAAYLASWADAPPSPTGIQATGLTGNQAKLSWTASNNSDLEKYLIALRNEGSVMYDSLLSVGKLTEFTFDLTALASGTVFANVAAVDKDGNESVFSEAVTIK